MNYRPSEMGKIINTRVSDYLSLLKPNNEPSSCSAFLDLAPSDKFAGIRVCLEFIPSWRDIFSLDILQLRQPRSGS